MIPSGEWGTALTRRIKDSLTIKIFLLMVFFMCVSSTVTYAGVAVFLPATYTNELDQVLEEASKELTEKLETYDKIDQVSTMLGYFELTYQTQVVLLDSEGRTVYPEWEGATVEMKAADTAESAWEDGEDQSVESFDGDVFYSMEQSQEGQTQSDLAETMKQYEVTIGDGTYTILVIGGMKAVSQAAEVLKRILPYIAGIVCALAVLTALISSLYLTRPIVALSRISQKMAALNFSEKCKETRSDEVGILGHSLNELSHNLSQTLDSLTEANEKLKSDIEREREIEKKRIAFFSAVSHELKTPITILKGHLGGMIMKIGGYRDRDAYLKRSLDVTDTMEAMVQELLTISRMESGKVMKKARNDMAEQVRIQLAEMTELIEERALDLSVEMPDHLYAETDAVMMEKVFRNVIVNAVRYSPKGEKIWVKLEQKKDRIYFAIENTGVYLPEESLNHIFEAFYRVEASRSRKTGGSGLGLYIVKMILEQHTAEYEIGNSEEGVRFAFSIKTT